MVGLITENLDAIAELCRTHGVRKLEVFGSATSDRFDPDTSDVDFVIDFLDYGPRIADRFLGFAESIERLLGRNVNFVFGDKPIKNPYFRASVNKPRVMVFEADNRFPPVILNEVKNLARRPDLRARPWSHSHARSF